MRWVKKPIAAQMKRAQTNMTYVVDGNKCANAVPQGQYFQLINSTIAGRSDGIYTASKAIPANEVIDNTYFSQTTPIAEGAINKINSELTALNSNLEQKANKYVNTTNSTNELNAVIASRLQSFGAKPIGEPYPFTIMRNDLVYFGIFSYATATVCFGRLFTGNNKDIYLFRFALGDATATVTVGTLN